MSSELSVVPFHCVICIEEFSANHRLPVVLPCGHTYVCNLCAEHLQHCMECGEPLSFVLPSTSRPLLSSPSVNNNFRSSSSSVNYRSTEGVTNIPSSNQSMNNKNRIRFPLPKNYVLISMMEAARSQQCKKSSLEKISSSSNDTTINDVYLNRIISDMATFSGPCGTYAVRDSKGLMVVPCHPDENRDDCSMSQREPFAIVQGQTVQIVDFRDGVAKLARGAGHIVATYEQLVKVGGPLERSCKLEGAMNTVVSVRGRNLELVIERNQRVENVLKREIELEKAKNPNFPIIRDQQQNFNIIATEHIKTSGNSPAESQQQQNAEEISSSQETKMDRLSTSDQTKEGEIPLPQKQSPNLQKGSPKEKGEQATAQEARDSIAVGTESVKKNATNEHIKLVFSTVPPPSDVPSPALFTTDNSEATSLQHRGEDDLNAYSYGCDTAIFSNSFLNFDDGNSDYARFNLSMNCYEDDERIQPRLSLGTPSASSWDHHYPPATLVDRPLLCQSESINSELNGNSVPMYQKSCEDELNVYENICGTALFTNNFLNCDEVVNNHPQRARSLSLDSYDNRKTQQRRMNFDTREVMNNSNNTDMENRIPPPSPNRKKLVSHVSVLATALTPRLSNSFDTAIDLRPRMNGQRVDDTKRRRSAARVHHFGKSLVSRREYFECSSITPMLSTKLRRSIFDPS